MDNKSKADKKCRKAARNALENVFVSSAPQDNLCQARGLVSFLQTFRLFENEVPDKSAIYGFGLIIMLLDILLEQAHDRIDSDASLENTGAENLSVVGE